MGKTIIVTGGAGFIGGNFVYYMLNKYPDYKIICVDCLTYAGNLSTLKDALKNPNFRFEKLNICDKEGIKKLFAEVRPDIVVNFAAESHVDRSIEGPSGNPHPRAQPVRIDRLMMETVDRQHRAWCQSKGAGKESRIRHRRAVGGKAVFRRVVEMLDQISAGDDIEQLAPGTDPEDRYVAPKRGGRKCEIEVRSLPAQVRFGVRLFAE